MQDLRGGDRRRRRSRPRQVRSGRTHHREKGQGTASAPHWRCRNPACPDCSAAARGRARLRPRRARPCAPGIERVPHRLRLGARSPPCRARAGRIGPAVRAWRFAGNLALQQPRRSRVADRDIGRSAASATCAHRATRSMRSSHAKRRTRPTVPGSASLPRTTPGPTGSACTTCSMRCSNFRPRARA